MFHVNKISAIEAIAAHRFVVVSLITTVCKAIPHTTVSAELF